MSFFDGDLPTVLSDQRVGAYTQRMEGRTWTRLRCEEELQAAGVSKEVSQYLLRSVRVIPAQGHCDLAHLLPPWGKVVYSKEMCK